MENLIEQLLGVLRGVVRWRWVACAVAWTISVAGWAWVATLPDVYRSYSRIYVDTQTLLNPLLRGLTVRPDPGQQVRLMASTLLSRPNLEEVVRRADLDHGIKNETEMQRLVTEIAKGLALYSTGGSGNLYQLSYSAEDPKLAARGVRETVNLFMERGLGNTARDLRKSQDFIEAQLRSYQARLVEIEQRVEKFKREHVGMLGRDGQDYYGRREAARAQLEATQLQLQEARDSRDAYRRQAEGAEPLMLFPKSGAARVDPEIAQRILSLEKQLDALRLRYTDEHPDVTATLRLIKELKERKSAAGQDPAEFMDTAGGSAFAEQMAVALAQADSQVAALETRVAAYAARYKAMAEAVDRIPIIEREYAALVRDQAILKSNYDSLLATREKATMSQEVEDKTTSVEFRIIDPPTIPVDPAAPNRLVLSTVVLLIGIGSGLGAAFLLSQLRPTVDSIRLLEELTGRTDLITVSEHQTESSHRARRRAIVSYSLAAVALVGVYTTVMTITLVR
jgi:polysaccharide chain length determinant protein (PEP-CTERM system associated)